MATRSPSQVGQELPRAGASDQGRVPNTSRQFQAPDSGQSAATGSSVARVALKPATAHTAASPPPQVTISKPSLALSNGPTESATIAAQQVESGTESPIRPPVHLPKISINPDAPDAGPEVAQQRSNTSKQDKTPVSAERPAPVKSGSSPRPEASGLPRTELPGIRGEATPHNRAPGSSLPQQTLLSGDGGRERGLRNPQAKVGGNRSASLQTKDSSPPPPLREAGKPFFQIAARTHYQHSGEAETTTVLENAPPASAPRTRLPVPPTDSDYFDDGPSNQAAVSTPTAKKTKDPLFENSRQQQAPAPHTHAGLSDGIPPRSGLEATLYANQSYGNTTVHSTRQSAALASGVGLDPAHAESALDQVIQSARLMKQDGRPSLEIHLKPDFLGKIRIDTVLNGNQSLDAVISVEQPKVRLFLENNMSQLLDRFDQAGIKLGHISFQDATGNPGSDSQQQQSDASNRGKTTSYQGPNHGPGDDREGYAKASTASRFDDGRMHYFA